MSDAGATARSDAGGAPDAAVPATPSVSGTPRTIRLAFRSEWTKTDLRGLLGSDSRVRTLRKVLVTYPAVRHILPDRISFEPTVDSRTVDTVARFLERQQWLVKSVDVD